LSRVAAVAENRRNRVVRDAARGAGNSGHWKGSPTLSNDRHNTSFSFYEFLQSHYENLAKFFKPKFQIKIGQNPA
jgi:hypothetical protein